MKESANIAYNYIKSNYKKYNIEYKKIEQNDIHIHVPEGATPKEGPSAGITLTTALISLLLDKKISNEIALTGKILPVGGLKEKIIGAYKNNINKIIIPKENKNDLDKIPEDIKEKVEFILVDKYDQVWDYIKEVK